MTEKLKQKITEEFKKLSKERLDAINSINWEEKTEEIANTFSLTGEELDNLQIETFLVFINVTDLALFKENIENNIGLTDDMAKKISVLAFEKIFTPIAKAMEQSVKNTMKSKNISWEETIDFITSGGDYSAFI